MQQSDEYREFQYSHFGDILLKVLKKMKPLKKIKNGLSGPVLFEKNEPGRFFISKRHRFY